jgi:cell division protease FtsH
MMGGRVAEEICLHQQTTGAEDDFRQAVELATKMVCKWGMSETLGPMSYLRDEGNFLGEQLNKTVYSESTGKIIDKEIKSVIEECYNEAKEILLNERDFLIYLADMLLVNETLDKEEIDIVYDCTTVKRATGKTARSKGDGMACAGSEYT